MDYQHAVIPLRGYCDACGEERPALLETFVRRDEDNVLRRTGTTVFLTPDDMVTTEYFASLEGGDVEVALHWEPYTDEEQKKRWLEVFAATRELQELGVYDEEDVFDVMNRYTRDPDLNSPKQRCGVFNFEDYQTGDSIRNIKYIIEFSEHVSERSLT